MEDGGKGRYRRLSVRSIPRAVRRGQIYIYILRLKRLDGRNSPKLGIVLANAISMKKWAAGQDGDPSLAAH